MRRWIQHKTQRWFIAVLFVGPMKNLVNKLSQAGEFRGPIDTIQYALTLLEVSLEDEAKGRKIGSADEFGMDFKEYTIQRVKK